jgi:hypothetical protein
VIGHRLGFDLDARRHRDGARQIRRTGHLHDRHGRNRRQVVRIEDVEERLRQFRQVVIELATDPGGEERERLDQTGDVRILNRVLTQAEAAGDLWVRFGKLRRQPADVVELPIVVGQQLVNHCRRHPQS